MTERIRLKLAELRIQMELNEVNTFIIPGTDPHLSEYISEHWKSREWISGFNGSAGTVVVTLDQVVLWTDSRYFLQADKQLSGTEIKLFKQGLPETPSINDWISQNITTGTVVAIDGNMFSTIEAKGIEEYFRDKGFLFNASFDPFPVIWENRPALPKDPIYLYPAKFAGEDISTKIKNVVQQMNSVGANAMMVSMLDEVAWALNIRGTDVECNPVGICFAFVSNKENVIFIDSAKVTPEIIEYFKENNIHIAAYEKANEYMSKLTPDTKILIDVKKLNYNLFKSIPGTCHKVYANSPIAMLKAVKNETEIAGFRDAMVKDGVALTKFCCWLEANIDSGKVTEMRISEKLIEFRETQDLFVGESFSTIAGFNGNGAIVHYRANEESDTTITRNGFLLIDSGGQYFDGTTDITRTIAMGALNENQKRDYTLVLKGHIGLATVKFPQGTRGSQLDILARKAMWDLGINYLHGTGHGIGHFMNVHEGPQSIRMDENPTQLVPGMVSSNEPGIYRTNEYGIRLENLILCVEAEKTEFGQFYQFDTITLFPFDKAAIDKNALTACEINWINEYHEMVFNKLSPKLNEAEKAWLKDKTTKI